MMIINHNCNLFQSLHQTDGLHGHSRGPSERGFVCACALVCFQLSLMLLEMHDALGVGCYCNDNVLCCLQFTFVINI